MARRPARKSSRSSARRNDASRPKSKRKALPRAPQGAGPGTIFSCEDEFMGRKVTGRDYSGTVLGCSTAPEGKRGRHLVVGRLAPAASVRRTIADREKRVKHARFVETFGAGGVESPRARSLGYGAGSPDPRRALEEVSVASPVTTEYSAPGVERIVRDLAIELLRADGNKRPVGHITREPIYHRLMELATTATRQKTDEDYDEWVNGRTLSFLPTEKRDALKEQRRALARALDVQNDKPWREPFKSPPPALRTHSSRSRRLETIPLRSDRMIAVRPIAEEVNPELDHFVAWLNHAARVAPRDARVLDAVGDTTSNIQQSVAAMRGSDGSVNLALPRLYLWIDDLSPEAVTLLQGMPQRYSDNLSVWDALVWIRGDYLANAPKAKTRKNGTARRRRGGATGRSRR